MVIEAADVGKMLASQDQNMWIMFAMYFLHTGFTQSDMFLCACCSMQL